MLGLLLAARQPHPAGPAHLAGKRREREDNLFDQQTPRLCLLISFLKIFFFSFYFVFVRFTVEILTEDLAISLNKLAGI